MTALLGHDIDKALAVQTLSAQYAVGGDSSGVLGAASFLVLATDPSLTSERVLTMGAGMAAGVDGGAGLTYTISLGLPSTLTVSSANSVSGTTHTHAIKSSSNPGAAAAILSTTAGGAVTLTGLATFNGGIAITGVTGNVTGNLIPATTDTYTLGTSSLLWSKGWLSELDAVLFAKNTISVVGGWMLVAKNSGVLTVAAGVGATVDFGMAMTLNQFVIFRAAGLVEYMKVHAGERHELQRYPQPQRGGGGQLGGRIGVCGAGCERRRSHRVERQQHAAYLDLYSRRDLQRQHRACTHRRHERLNEGFDRSFRRCRRPARRDRTSTRASFPPVDY